MKTMREMTRLALVGMIVMSFVTVASVAVAKQKVTDPKLQEPNQVTRPGGETGGQRIQPVPRPTQPPVAGGGTVIQPPAQGPKQPIQSPPFQPQGVMVNPPVYGAGPVYGQPGVQGVVVNPGMQGIDINPVPPISTHGLRVDVWTDDFDYYEGEQLSVFFRANRDSFIYIFNIDTLGRHRQIFPNHFDRDNFVQGGVTYRIPDRGYTFDVTVHGRGGSEKMHAVAVKERYDVCQGFDVLRPDDPYPLRTATSLLLKLQSSTSRRTSSRDWSLGLGINTGVQGIDINPIPGPEPTYVYAEDFTFYQVYPRNYRHPNPVPPPWSPNPPPRPNPPHYGATLRITTAPGDALIYINREYKGHSPLTLTGLRPGNYKIYVEKNGYEPTAEWVRIGSSGVAHKSIKLFPQRRPRLTPHPGRDPGPKPRVTPPQLQPIIRRPGGDSTPPVLKPRTGGNGNGNGSGSGNGNSYRLQPK